MKLLSCIWNRIKQIFNWCVKNNGILGVLIASMALGYTIWSSSQQSEVNEKQINQLDTLAELTKEIIQQKIESERALMYLDQKMVTKSGIQNSENLLRHIFLVKNSGNRSAVDFKMVCCLFGEDKFHYTNFAESYNNIGPDNSDFGLIFDKVINQEDLKVGYHAVIYFAWKDEVTKQFYNDKCYLFVNKKLGEYQVSDCNINHLKVAKERERTFIQENKARIDSMNNVLQYDLINTKSN